jgi:hypothetical protein
VAAIDFGGPNVGGNKSRPYLFSGTSFVVAGFIPACRFRLLKYRRFKR